MQKYQALTYEERLKIEAGIKQGKNCNAIAKELGRARQTVYREVAMFSEPKSYNADLAQQKRGYRSKIGGL